MTKKSNLLAWTIAVVGLWLFVSAFMPFAALAVLWNDVVVGVVAAVAGYLLAKEKSWQGWTAAILGFWLFIAAFVPDLQAHAANQWNSIVVGILLMIAGFRSLEHKSHQVAHQ